MRDASAVRGRGRAPERCSGRKERGRRRAAAGLAAVALLAAGGGCAAARGGWDWRAFESAHPAVRAFPGQRLRDAHPYFRPVFLGDRAVLELFLCRWSVPRTLRVALPPDADPDERALIDRALRAWEQAGLGLRFVRSSLPADVEIRFVEGEGGGAWPRTALTGADCRADGRGPMEHARIWLDRANLDLLGRPRPLSPEEFLGATLHELGHALGFQGHGVVGPSVVVGEVDRVKRAGAGVLAGRPLEDPSLRALYAAPEGAVVGRLPLPPAESRRLRALVAEASQRGLEGPFVRVGDRSARFFWKTSAGREVGFVVPHWSEVVRDPGRLRIVVDRAARPWLVGAAAPPG